jgi:hypothetical protein
MRTIVYIDGLNFYYGCTKGTPYRWVDLKALSQKIIGSKNEIVKIKLFSAIVKPTSTDSTVHIRQTTYFRALQRYIPEIEIYKGHFLEHEVSMRLSQPIGKQRFAKVIKREEKGSDVNLAVHFLNDAWLNSYECGIIISNDSDLVEAVKLVRHQTNKKIGIISPFPTVSKELKQYSHFQRQIRKSALAASQMPDTIPNTNITKPESW